MLLCVCCVFLCVRWGCIVRLAVLVGFLVGGGFVRCGFLRVWLELVVGYCIISLPVKSLLCRVREVVWVVS